MNRFTQSNLRRVRLTDPRYWVPYQQEPWFKAIRSARRVSALRLREELADLASDLRTENRDRVITEYRKLHELERESRWRPRNRWDIPTLGL